MRRSSCRRCGAACAAPAADELRRGLDETEPETGASDLIAPAPSAPTISRRGVLGLTGGASLGLLALPRASPSAGRCASSRCSPRTAATSAAARTTSRSTRPPARSGSGSADRRRLAPARRRRYARGRALARGAARAAAADLRAADRLRRGLVDDADLERRARCATWRRSPASRRSTSCSSSRCRRPGSFRRATLSPAQVAERRSLLALRVNGADLSPDHGYPARIVVPALPGVHCTKWVERLEFRRTRA